MSVPIFPRLRALQVKRVLHEGRSCFLLRDHLSIGEGYLLLPVELGPVLMMLDGEHDERVIRARALLEYGLEISPAQLASLVRQLDEALLLEGERWEQAQAAALRQYRRGEARTPAFAGVIYPAEPGELAAALVAYEEQHPRQPPAENVVGVLSPHIDYGRGGSVYARGWQQAAEAVRAAQTVIVLGTDHIGSSGALTLTRQRYRTPWGLFPRDDRLLEALCGVLGDAAAFAEEIHHRNEHSIELAAVWLHHVRGGTPVRLLPVLCGHPAPFMQHGIDSDPAIAAAIALLHAAVAEGALVVVAGDLSHVGPEFGDPRPFGERERMLVRGADEALIAACAGGAGAMLAASRAIEDRYRVCGLSPLALALAILPPVSLQVAAYDQCTADAEDASFVSIAGGSFVRQ